MAVSRQKCPSCGGALAYNRATRLWDCPYCGGSFKIQERQSGPYDIKNVAASVLLDAAKALFPQGQKDLAECEKLGPDHPATLLARIGLYHAWLTAPAPGDGAAMAAMLEQLRRDKAALLAGGPAERDDEEALWETLPDGSLAVLLLACRDLGLDGRAGTLEQRLQPDRVYQLPVNQALFRHYLKAGDYDRLDAVIANQAHLDRHRAMLDLLDAPDGPRKADYLAALTAGGALTGDDRPLVERYLRAGTDSAATRAALVCALCEAGLRPSVACVVECLLPAVEEAEAPALLQALCAQRLYEEDLRCLLQYGLTEAPLPVLEALLAAVAGSGQYVKPDARLVSGFLGRTELPAARRLDIFAALRELRLEERALEQIFQDYLLHAGDGPEDRAAILDILIDLPERFSPAVFEQYLLGCTLDSDYKAGIAQTMMDKGVNAGAIRGLLGRYLQAAPDPAPVGREIVDLLLDAGLYLPPAELLETLCTGADTPAGKLAMLRRMQANGAVLPAGAASRYLEVVPPGDYSRELLAALWRETDPVSDKALFRYVLLCPDAAKAGHAAALAAQAAGPLGSQAGTALHLGHRLEGNLFQLYLLCAADDADTARAVAAAMRAARAVWNADLAVDGTPTRFKKYAKTNRAALSPLAAMLCEENRVFAGLF